MAVTRRAFIQTSTTGVAAIFFGCRVATKPSTAPTKAGKSSGFEPNAWIRIAADGAVTVIIAECEMGQGVTTSMPMIVADELRADWKTIGWEFALNDPQKYGDQLTGGSKSIREN